MTKYRLKNIDAPGYVNIFNPITQRAENVYLQDIDDILAEELVKKGCPYLELIPAKKVTEAKAE